MKLVNKTPHPFKLFKEGKLVLNLKKAENPARVATKDKLEDVTAIDNVDIDLATKIFSTEFGEITNLPAPKDNTLYIVSRIVASASDREDLVVPNDLMRKNKGQVVGCRSLTLG